MEQENNQIISHEEEILVEGQLVGDDAGYYEYVEVDESAVDQDSKDHVFIEGGEEVEIDGDEHTYMAIDGGSNISNDQYYEGEEQIDEHGQLIRVVHSRQPMSNNSYPVQYLQQRSVQSYSSRLPQYHVQSVGGSTVGSSIMSGSSSQGRVRSVAQRLPYNYQNVSPRRQFASPHHQSYQQQPHHQYERTMEHRGLGSSSASTFRSQRISPTEPKIKGYYEGENVKSMRPAGFGNALMNISNTSSVGSPLVSTLGYPRNLNSSNLPNATARDSYTGGTILTSFLGTSKAANKIRKASSKKKPCNCTKSMCLKLYCDCFANGEFCLDCNCKDCHNNLEHESERSKAIKSSLERNPSAFKPKIGVAAKIGRSADMERLHQKGCHCKKSNCLKNYCECYEAKVPCTDRCKCCSCRNTEHDRQHKFKDKFSGSAGGLAQLAAVAAADARSGSPFSDDEDDDACGVSSDQPNPKTQPWFYLTEDVTEAITMCLVAQAQEMEQNNIPEESLEQGILQEFGRCLEQIIDNAKFCQQTVIA